MKPDPQLFDDVYLAPVPKWQLGAFFVEEHPAAKCNTSHTSNTSNTSENYLTPGKLELPPVVSPPRTQAQPRRRRA